jgi:hypothetical protein
VRQGRITRPRLDVYLNYWLIMRLADEVPSHSVFPKFRGYAESGLEIDVVLQDIAHVARTFRSFDEFPPWSPEGRFVYRWRTLDAGVSTPVLTGVVWILQGFNVLPGSFMTGQMIWAYIGIAVSMIGSVVIWIAVRGGSSERE